MSGSREYAADQGWDRNDYPKEKDNSKHRIEKFKREFLEALEDDLCFRAQVKAILAQASYT